MAGSDIPERFHVFQRIFHPGRVAVVGVSGKGAGFGRGVLLSLQSMGFAGDLFPINPNGGSVAGLKIYRTIRDIPGDIDFAIIAVPAGKVPEALEACRVKGAVGAEILSSGFKELGTPEGIERDRQIQEIASRGIRVLGPNCFGIYCPKSGLTMLPGPDLSRESGPVAFLSQSGGLSIDFTCLGKWQGVRFSKVVSFGNGCDLRETEMLEYLYHDPDTGIVCLYIEGVTDGPRFLRILAQTALKKPVIVMKGGLSASGSRAVASHTASLGGSRVIWESALAQCNALQVDNLREMADAALAFSMLPTKKYQHLALVGGGGALGVTAADAAESLGLAIPPLQVDVQAKIEPLLPQPGSSAANPIDIANPFVTPENLKQILVAAAEEDSIDIHVVSLLLYHFKNQALAMSTTIRQITPCRQLAEACREAKDIGQKPVVVVLPNYKQEPDALDIETVIRETRQHLLSAGIPVFDEIHSALKAISSVSRYASRREAIASAMHQEPSAGR